MNRFHASLLVVFVWALVFLPGLGSPELKGEEGRRILPAITMLDTHEWLVPYVGGKPFLRKPPLVNWVIASAFQITGVRNEWTARLPSALAVLAVALGLVLLSGRPGWLAPEPAFVAAVLFLTQLATMEKGRLAEIEALYFSLSGLATVCWMGWWAQRRSPWLLWTVPWLLLGLGVLTKGPFHLLFFYSIAVCVLWRAGELRQLWHPAHALGLALMCGLWFAWEIPYARTEAGHLAREVWQAQSTGRLTWKFDGDWLLNFPRAATNHLPWLLFAPLLWRRPLAQLGAREEALFRGTRLATVVTFCGVLLVPGMLPRYTLPLLAPFAVLLAYALSDERLAPKPLAMRAWWRTNTALAAALVLAACATPAAYAAGRRHFLLARDRFPGDFGAHFELALLAAAGALLLALLALLGRRRLARPALLAAASGGLFGAAALLYAALGIPFLNAMGHLRPAAREIDGAIPVLPPRDENGPLPQLWLYDPDYQPVIFYLQTPYAYAVRGEDIPPNAEWLLMRQDPEKRFLEARPEYHHVSAFPKLHLALLQHSPVAEPPLPSPNEP